MAADCGCPEGECDYSVDRLRRLLADAEAIRSQAEYRATNLVEGGTGGVGRNSNGALALIADLSRARAAGCSTAQECHRYLCPRAAPPPS